MPAQRTSLQMQTGKATASYMPLNEFTAEYNEALQLTLSSFSLPLSPMHCNSSTLLQVKFNADKIAKPQTEKPLTICAAIIWGLAI